jgi:hypothetical protein
MEKLCIAFARSRKTNCFQGFSKIAQNTEIDVRVLLVVEQIMPTRKKSSLLLFSGFS